MDIANDISYIISVNIILSWFIVLAINYLIEIKIFLFLYFLHNIDIFSLDN